MVEFKRLYRLILTMLLLALPATLQLMYGIEHHNRLVLYVLAGSIALNSWIYMKWWILEGKN